MKLKITVHGVSYEVDVEVLDTGEGFLSPAAAPLPKHGMGSPLPRPGEQHAPPRPAARPGVQPAAAPNGGGSVVSPIAGTVLEVKCKPGDSVVNGQILIVVEAMKMEANISAPAAGKIRSVEVAVGDAIQEGQVVIRFE